MNILVIGLGSMGKRRIRLMQESYPDFLIFGVDTREDRRKEVSDRFNITCVESVDTAYDSFEIAAAFVCTAPLSHSQVVTQCLKNKWHTFTEINLVADGYKINMDLARKNKCKLFLSSTFLYREEICYIQEQINNDRKWNYIYHIGQYLPDWHPWENYKDFFVGDSRTNGCREIMAIELPWIIKTFGEVVNTNVYADKITELNISYCDNYMIQLKHMNGNKGILVIDVVSPVAVRKLEIYSEQNYIEWSGTPDSLYEYCIEKNALVQVQLSEHSEHDERYRNFIIENAYRNEIRDFMDVIFQDKEPQYGFLQDLEILNLIDVLEGKT